MADADKANFQFLAEHSLDIICRASLNRIFLYVSPASFRILGWKPEEMIGKAAAEFILAEDHPVLDAAIAEEEHTITIRMLRKDGRYAWMENHAHLVRDPATGEAQEWVVLLRDATERKIQEEKLFSLAHTDGLTGLANRRSFDEKLAQEWRRTVHEGSELSLLLLDIDSFKNFNDRYGHQSGDDCLRTVAHTVKGSLRETDFAARYGGEELAIILLSTGAAGAADVAGKIRFRIEALQIAHESSPETGGIVTVSIGAATVLARHAATIRMPDSLLQAADNALYQAKREGRNRVATALMMAYEENTETMG